ESKGREIQICTKFDSPRERKSEDHTWTTHGYAATAIHKQKGATSFLVAQQKILSRLKALRQRHEEITTNVIVNSRCHVVRRVKYVWRILIEYIVHTNNDPQRVHIVTEAGAMQEIVIRSFISKAIVAKPRQPQIHTNVLQARLILGSPRN